MCDASSALPNGGQPIRRFSVTGRARRTSPVSKNRSEISIVYIVTMPHPPYASVAFLGQVAKHGAKITRKKKLEGDPVGSAQAKSIYQWLLGGRSVS